MLTLLVGCSKKSEKATEPTAAPGAPANTSAVSAKPVPSFSAAQQVGMYVFPKGNQTHDQQLIDESECSGLAQQQSGVDPQMAPPAPPTEAEMQAAQQQGAASAHQAQGGRIRGAARGALGGAVIGGISGNAGTGAAVGATVGTVRGGRQQRASNAAAQQQGANAAAADLQQQYQQQESAYQQQMDNFKRAMSACLDARGYSVK